MAISSFLKQKAPIGFCGSGEAQCGVFWRGTALCLAGLPPLFQQPLANASTPQLGGLPWPSEWAAGTGPVSFRYDETSPILGNLLFHFLAPSPSTPTSPDPLPSFSFLFAPPPLFLSGYLSFNRRIVKEPRAIAVARHLHYTATREDSESRLSDSSRYPAAARDPPHRTGATISRNRRTRSSQSSIQSIVQEAEERVVVA